MKFTLRNGVVLVLICILGLVIRIWVGPAPFAEAPHRRDLPVGPPGRVVFITLDGIHIREGNELGSVFEKKYSAFYFGGDEQHERMWVSNSSLRSQAGYQSIFSGQYIRDCWDNECSAMSRPTLFDSLMDQSWDVEDVAAFSSWKGIGLTIETHPRVVRSIGFSPIANLHSISESDLKSFQDIESASRDDMPSWASSRWDRFTWKMATEYEYLRKPRFLTISLGDADEYGHMNDREAYRKSITEFAENFSIFYRKLAADPKNDDLSFVITTDHGRGDFLFSTHGWWEPTSARIWTIVLPSKKIRALGLERQKSKVFRQVDLRPTLETLLGVRLQVAREGDTLVHLDRTARVFRGAKSDHGDESK